ncbi:AraC family transcriptional regulator [Paenibacillus sp. S150]|uniref:AraC family transcriptional regulator n=1 Tax=Paenibacillus sp. S150 TaxID=2749826 RepID=UPI001C65FFA1|nr:AraC family transcriptional regulator [Paenibacillus sp. S150]
MLNHLFFHIHYCNFRAMNDTRRPSSRIRRTLDHHELVFVSAGKGSIVIDSKKYAFTAGMLFYLTPGLPHTIKMDVREPGVFQTVHFSYAHVGFQEGEWSVRAEAENLPLQAAQKLKDYYQVEEQFHKLVEGWNAKLPGYKYVSKTNFQQLLIAIYHNTKKQNQNYATSLKVERLIEYMRQNVHRKVTLTELSEQVQLSSTYLSRAFKEITGYSIIGFFNQLKLDAAKEMLLGGELKVKEVAGALGFADEFYFSRIFKKTEGISPSEFHSKNVHGV